MATTFHPYLFFSGDCREAFTRYGEIFGGELTILANSEAPDGGMPGATTDFVMHAAVTLPDGGLLMGSDDPTGTGGPKWGVAVNVGVDTEDEARRVYDALADGGSADMPLEATFWSPAFGSLTDRWGVSWLVGVPGEPQTS